MSRLDVLAQYARLANPSATLPPSILLLENPKTITIFDAYPKAKYHFLVIPRASFPLKETAAKPRLDNLRQLLASDHAVEVLEAIKEAVEEVTWLIRDEMDKSYGWTWGVNAGFHAEESMHHIHAHVISDDYVSDSLKNKKHWNSFRTDLGFWQPLEDILDDPSKSLRSASYCADLLKAPLEDPRTDETFSTIPKLKAHLLARWEAEGKRQKRKKDPQP